MSDDSQLRPAVSIVDHASFAAYASACISGSQPRDGIPICSGSPPAVADSRLVEGLARSTWRLDSSISTVMVCAADSPAAVCAALLARSIGARLQIVHGLEGEWLEEDGPRCVVALASEIGDALLVAALGRCAQGRRSTRWGGENSLCFVTAGDFAALSRYTARLVAAYHSPPGARTFLMLVSESGRTIRRSLIIGGDGNGSLDEVPPGLVGRVLTEAAGVIALYGHGGEACAQGGGITVLCGRRRGAWAAADGGVLACKDDSASCPRGPSPLPLSTLQAQHLMQASCSSARLRDSAVASDFNLLLSYIDGRGLSYVGAVTGGGRPECCLLYLAAMADGRTLGETVSLVNFFLEAAAIDAAVYVGVGLPELRAAPPAAEPAEDGHPARCSGDGDREYSLDFGGQHLATFLWDDPVAIDLAAAGHLALRIRGGAETLWFSRKEDACATDQPLHVRLFFFSFPSPLGRLRFSPRDSDGLTGSLRAGLSAIRRWTDYHRLVTGSEGEGVTAGQRAETHYCEILPPLLDRLPYSGTADELLECASRSMSAARRLLRDLLLLELEKPLSGAFWLSNAFSRDQQFLRAEANRCVACGGVSLRQQVRSRLSDEIRLVDVCMRCGITQDVRADSHIREILIDAPPSVTRGTRLSIGVGIRSQLEGREFAVLGAFSGPYSPKLDSQTILATTNRGAAHVTFSFELPAIIPPHEYRWKGIVADEDDIAFVTRRVFVTDETG